MNLKKSNIIYSIFLDNIGGNRDVQTIEYLIFLTQLESIKELKKPMLNNIIYIQNKTIRIEYISDLLRVGSKTYIAYRGNDITQMFPYVDILHKYDKYTNDEIEDLIKKIVIDKNLDETLFLNENYKNKYRKIARFVMNQHNHLISKMILYILIGLPCIVLFIMTLIGTYFVSRYPEKVQIGMEHISLFMIIDLLLLITFVCWIFIWMRPTKYEIANEYLEE